MPRPKLKFEEAWKWTGGNPEMLARLHLIGWKIEEAAETLIEKWKLRLFASSLSDEEKTWLLETVEDPDTLFGERLPLMDKLIEQNLIDDSIEGRENWYWIDEPPPEMDLELGIGEYVIWQTPLHREAARRALAEA